MLKLRGVPLVHFALCYYEWKSGSKTFLSRCSLRNPAFSVLRVRLSARMSSVRWPKGLVFARRFLLFVSFEIRIPGWRVSMLPVRTQLCWGKQNLPFSPSISFPSISFLVCFYLVLDLFGLPDGSTSGVPPIILRTKHEGNCRASWSFANSMAMFFRTALDSSSIFRNYRFLLIVTAEGSKLSGINAMERENLPNDFLKTSLCFIALINIVNKDRTLDATLPILFACKIQDYYKIIANQLRRLVIA